MWSPSLLVLLIGVVAAQETILGVYMFHRHGDRTPKALAPSNLTDLGYAQVYSSGGYYRDRYVSSDATSKVQGLNTDVVKQTQISVSAPQDTVLMSSALGFLQALYPPVGSQLSVESLRNGSNVQAPMNGYQLISVATVATGSGSEDNGWLQSATDCGNAETSSSQYFNSSEYMSQDQNTKQFYQDLLPVVTPTFNSSYMTYKNAYTIFVLINVATIHNKTIPSSTLLTPTTLTRLTTLAATHELSLAYNATSPIRAIAGMQLAAEALQYLNSTIASAGAKKLGIQFGAYGTFQSYFGLANLTTVDPLFSALPDYASSMVWELFTSADMSAGFPAAEDLSVRFLYHDGTVNSSSPLVQYPLFGGRAMSMPWTEFVVATGRIAVGSTQEWCVACGNVTGACTPYASIVTPAAGSEGLEGSGGSGLSRVVCGVIGALVTLGVIMLIEGGIMLGGGLTLVRRKRLVAGRAVAQGSGSGVKA